MPESDNSLLGRKLASLAPRIQDRHPRAPIKINSAGTFREHEIYNALVAADDQVEDSERAALDAEQLEPGAFGCLRRPAIEVVIQEGDR